MVAPTLCGLALSPSAIDVSAGAQTVVVTLTVTDDENVTGKGTATVTILTPREGVKDLLDLIASYHLKPGVECGLEFWLHRALMWLWWNHAWWHEAACNELRAYIWAVEWMGGKGLTPAQAAELVSRAERILAALHGSHDEHCRR